MEEESSVQYLHFHPPHGSQDHSHVQTPPQDKKKERFDEKQSNDIENQKSKRKREMNEQSSFDWKIEEKMKSAPNENKTSGGKSDEENIIKGKGIEETPTEHDAALPLCIDSVKNNVFQDNSNENYYDQLDRMEEAKHLEEKLQEFNHNVHDMTADEPYKEKQGEPMDLETPECQDHTSNLGTSYPFLLASLFVAWSSSPSDHHLPSSRRLPSWQTYVDDHLLCEIEGNHLSSAAIVGQDGSVWAQSSNFPQFKPKEITAIMNDFAEP
ncbi:hypothetical protein HN873_029077 [Arachis hypogaea]